VLGVVLALATAIVGVMVASRSGDTAMSLPLSSYERFGDKEVVREWQIIGDHLDASSRGHEHQRRPPDR
jgi:hypothetical protein